MSRIFILMTVILLFAAATAFAGIKPCDELKAEIDAKLQAKGVQSYTLEVVPADQVREQKVVGTCDGGRMKIIYTKEKS
jgi:hypothetical protein